MHGAQLLSESFSERITETTGPLSVSCGNDSISITINGDCRSCIGADQSIRPPTAASSELQDHPRLTLVQNKKVVVNQNKIRNMETLFNSGQIKLTASRKPDACNITTKLRSPPSFSWHTDLKLESSPIFEISNSS